MSKHTTVRLNPGITRKARAYAKANSLTFTAVMERALTAYLARSGRSAAKPVTFPTFSTGGVLPGVNLDDTSQLLDIMDGIREPD